MPKTEYKKEYGELNEQDMLILNKQHEFLRKQRKRKRREKQLMRLLSFLAIVAVVAVAALAVRRLGKKEELVPLKSSTVMSESRESTEEKTENKTQLSESEKAKSDFSSFYYYEADREERYEAYAKQNPAMSADDVVWRVNSNLDKPWYEYDVPTDGYDDPYIIVNKYYKVPDGYRPPDLVSVDGYEMRKETGEAFKKMKQAAAADGKRIRVVSAYRTVEYQRGLYNRYLSTDSRANVDTYSARAGYSEHHTGMAIDLFGSSDGLRNFVNTPEYAWVRDNAYKYGFIIRYTTANEEITGYENEPWHLRYIGAKAATDMREKGISSFEEYHVKYIEHSK